MYVYACVCTCVHLCMCVYVQVSVCVHACMYMYMCVWVCMCVCVYVRNVWNLLTIHLSIMCMFFHVFLYLTNGKSHNMKISMTASQMLLCSVHATWINSCGLLNASSAYLNFKCLWSLYTYVARCCAYNNT